MAKYNLDEKWLVKQSKRTIRNKAIVTYAPVWRGTCFYKNDIKSPTIKNETNIQSNSNSKFNIHSKLII